MYMRRVFVVLACCAWLLPLSAQAARGVEMEDPKEYFFSEGKTVSPATVAAIVKEAMGKSSFGAVQWKITNESPGRISVQFGKTNAYAHARVEYTDKQVVLHYETSQGLKYSAHGDRKTIHPAYNQWLDKFSSNLAAAARNMAGLPLATRDEMALYEGIKAGKPLIVVAASGITRGTRLSDAQWADYMSRDLGKQVPRVSNGKAVGKAVEWTRPMRKLSQKGYKKGLNQRACGETGAGAMVTVWFDMDPGDNTWMMFRDGRFTHYDCKTGALIEKTYPVKPDPNDKYPLENGIKHAFKLLFAEHSLY